MIKLRRGQSPRRFYPYQSFTDLKFLLDSKFLHRIPKNNVKILNFIASHCYTFSV